MTTRLPVDHRPRLLLTAAAVGAAIAAAVTGRAQVPTYVTPTSPISPTSYAQCAALDKAWQSVRDETNRQHQACINQKRDKPCKPTNSVGCECDECASLHNSSLLGQREVQACNAKVKDYLEKQAREREQREAAEAKRQADAAAVLAAEKARDSAKRPASDKAAPPTTTSKGSTAAKAPAAKPPASAPAKAPPKETAAPPPTTSASDNLEYLQFLAQLRAEESARQAAAEVARRAALQAEREQASQGALASLIDPTTGRPIDATKLAGKEPGLANPFGPSISSTRPFDGPSPLELKKEAREETERLNLLLSTATKSLEIAEQELDSPDAKRFFDSETMDRYLMNAESLHAVAKGASKILNWTEYASQIKSIADSDGTRQTDAWGEFVVHMVKDIATKGLEVYGPRVIGKTATSVLQAYTLPVALYFDHIQLNRDPQEIIRDQRTSLEEKQEAFATLNRQYQKLNSWQPAMLREYEELSAIVYQNATAEERKIQLRIR